MGPHKDVSGLLLFITYSNDLDRDMTRDIRKLFSDIKDESMTKYR